MFKIGKQEPGVVPFEAASLTESGDNRKERGAVNETAGMWDICLYRPPAGRMLSGSDDKTNYLVAHTGRTEHGQQHCQ